MTDRRGTRLNGPATPSKKKPAFVPFLTGKDLPDELVDRLCNVLSPPNPALAEVDIPAFVRLIGASISINALEKLQVFNALPTLTQFQVDKLIEVLSCEINEFAKIVSDEWPTIASLSAKSWIHLCMVADLLGAGYPDDLTERKALTRMLKRKFCGKGRKHWVMRAHGLSPLGDHVFSAFANAQLHSTGRIQFPEVF